MTMVSKYPLNKKVEDRVYSIFLETLADIKTSKEVGEFLNEFLSPTEKIMLAKRLSIALLLTKNYDFRTICKILKVSPTTVSDMNIWVKHNNGALKKVLNNILKKEKSEDFWKSIDYFLEKLAVPMHGTNWSARRSKVEMEHIRRRRVM